MPFYISVFSFEDLKVFAFICFDIVLHDNIEKDDLVFPTDIDLMDKENLLPSLSNCRNRFSRKRRCIDGLLIGLCFIGIIVD